MFIHRDAGQQSTCVFRSARADGGGVVRSVHEPQRGVSPSAVYVAYFRRKIMSWYNKPKKATMRRIVQMLRNHGFEAILNPFHNHYLRTHVFRQGRGYAHNYRYGHADLVFSASSSTVFGSTFRYMTAITKNTLAWLHWLSTRRPL